MCIPWEEVEMDFVTEAKGDILTIMDACFAGSVQVTTSGTNGRTYEFLAACAELTQRPGEQSFTTALIQTLKDLLREDRPQGFTTTRLAETIGKQQHRLRNPPRLLHRSIDDDRRIVLTPLRITNTPTRRPSYFDNTAIPAYLTLRVELKTVSITEDEVEDLSRRVSQAVRQSRAKTRRIDWLRLSPRRPARLKDVVRAVMASDMLTRKRLGHASAVQTAAGVTGAEGDQDGVFASFGFVTKHTSRYYAIMIAQPWPRVATAMLGIGALMFCFKPR